MMIQRDRTMSDNTEYLRRIAVSLESIARAMAPQHAPDYQHDLTDFPDFDWTSIGATVTFCDRDGAAVVTWGGHTYIRRSPHNKFDVAIWFSRCVGKENGELVYERLITFKRMRSGVEPLPTRVSQQLSSRLN